MANLTKEELELLWRQDESGVENDVYAPIRSLRPDQDKEHMGLCYRNVDLDTGSYVKVRRSPTNYIPYCKWDVALASKVPNREKNSKSVKLPDGFTTTQPRMDRRKNPKGLALFIIQLVILFFADWWLPAWFSPGANIALDVLAIVMGFLMNGPWALLGFFELIPEFQLATPSALVFIELVPFHTVAYIIRALQRRARIKTMRKGIAEKTAKINQFRAEIGKGDLEISDDELFKALYSESYPNYNKQVNAQTSFLRRTGNTFEVAKKLEFEDFELDEFDAQELDAFNKALLEKGYSKAEIQQAFEKGDFTGFDLDKVEIVSIFGEKATDIDEFIASIDTKEVETTVQKIVPTISSRYRSKIRL